ncbi:hypothetical protein Pelo_267 [Pelomyxa schiedti]|nr:hypothetical protein Pelo_267 [Pelomyxa schiedti]
MSTTSSVRIEATNSHVLAWCGTHTDPRRKKIIKRLEGKQQGQGTLTTAEGDKYNGSWKAGKFDGLGTYTWVAAGKSYEGLWNRSTWRIVVTLVVKLFV